MLGLYAILTFFFSLNFALDDYRNIRERRSERSVGLAATTVFVSFCIYTVVWPLIVMRIIWNSFKG